MDLEATTLPDAPDEQRAAARDAAMTTAFKEDEAVVVGADGQIQAWDTVTLENKLTLRGHAGEIMDVQFSPDGLHFASGSVDKTIKVWKVGDRKPICTLRGHTGKVTSLTYSPDGSRIITGGLEDGTIRIWDSKTGDLLQTRVAHAAGVSHVGISPDGSQIITGSFPPRSTIGYEPILTLQEGFGLDRSPRQLFDRTLKIWDAESVEMISNEAWSAKRFAELTVESKKTHGPWRVESYKSAVTLYQTVAERNPWSETYQGLTRWAPRWHSQQALRAESDENWLAAQFHLMKLVKRSPDNAKLASRLRRVHRNWISSAFSQQGDDQLASALVSLIHERVGELVQIAETTETLYSLACIRSLWLEELAKPEQPEMDEAEQPDASAERERLQQEALEALKKAIQAGFADWSLIESDSDLDGIRKLPAFKEILLRVHQNSLEKYLKLAANDPTNLRAQTDLAASYARLGDLQLPLGQSSHALASYQKSLEIFAKLAADDPTDAQAQHALFIAHYKIGGAYQRIDAWSDAANAFRRASAAAERLLNQGQLVPFAERAKAAMDQRAEAADKGAITFGPWASLLDEPAESLPVLLHVRSIEFSKRSRFAEAAQAADKLRGMKNADKDQLYDAACVFSMCAASIQPGDMEELTAEQTKQREQHIADALATLKQAIDAGYDNYAHMKEDPDLAILRDRAEFKAMLPKSQ